MKKNKWFWSLPLILCVLQLFFTLNSMSQIRYEELAESVRNVFWLENATIYDGVSSNVGWYGTLLIIYKTLGFSLHTAKFFRLFLVLLSLFCLAALLKKYLGPKKAIVPLLVFGLSPTLLYFNTLQTSYGLDLQYLPICLYLLLTINFRMFWSALLKQIILWSVVMVAWMSYPTFVFFLPALGLLFLWQIFKQVGFKKPLLLSGSFLVSLFSFIWPLVAAFAYVKDKNLLMFDPVVKSGIFRGAGSFYFDAGSFLKNISRTFSDLFIQSGSYYFEIASVDFSNIYPSVAVLMVLIVSLILLFKARKLRLPLVLSWFTLIFGLLVANFTADPTGYPGIRRNTALLASFYALYATLWYWVLNQKWQSFQFRNIVMTVLLLVPLHHLLAYPVNIFNLGKPSPYQYTHIFTLSDTPSKSLDLMVERVQSEDLKLACYDPEGNLTTCRYVEGYAAVSGYCLWNGLNCHKVLGYDSKRSEFIPLSLDLWEKYYWAH